MTRTCKLHRNQDVLVITTDTGKRRKVSVYLVTDLRPDKRVADPAYRLQKLTPGGEAWDVHVDQNGATCSCPDQDFRGTHREYCKHVLALQKLGLM